MDQTKISQDTDSKAKNWRGRPLAIGATRAVNITVRMPDELTSAIDVIARAHGISRSDAARRLIEDGIRSGASAEWVLAGSAGDSE